MAYYNNIGIICIDLSFYEYDQYIQLKSESEMQIYCNGIINKIKAIRMDFHGAKQIKVQIVILYHKRLV